MLTRRAFCALLGALPVVRLLAGVRISCRHWWQHYQVRNSIGPLREWVAGTQCQHCGHIRVTERVTVRWGRLGP